MGEAHKLTVLLPAVVTVLVVVLVENTYNVRGALAPLLHHFASHARGWVSTIVGSVRG